MRSNFETPRDKLMHIVLAGQPQLPEKLARPSMVQLRQRISMLIHLRPLRVAETAGYVGHRLLVAGFEGPPLFSSGALSAVASLSEGIPHSINNLCFNALSLGYASGRKLIASATVREVAVDQDLSSFSAESVSSPVGEATEPPSSLHRRGFGQPDGWAILLDRVRASAGQQPYSITGTEAVRPTSRAREQGSRLTEGMERHADRPNLRMVN
jgi:hypothetical protein